MCQYPAPPSTGWISWTFWIDHHKGTLRGRSQLGFCTDIFAWAAALNVQWLDYFSAFCFLSFHRNKRKMKTWRWDVSDGLKSHPTSHKWDQDGQSPSCAQSIKLSPFSRHLRKLVVKWRNKNKKTYMKSEKCIKDCVLKARGDSTLQLLIFFGNRTLPGKMEATVWLLHRQK